MNATLAEPPHFLFRLIPPRPTFAQDMTPVETEIMQRHVVYWTGKMQSGAVLLFGPVADPKGPWGVGVIRVAAQAEAEALRDGDPAMTANIGFRCELLPMPMVVAPA
jgi:hypothetical protein